MFKSDVIFDTKYWHDERRLNPWNNALNDSLEFHKFHILLNCFVGGIYCWTNERNGMLLKFCLNGASTLGHRTRGKSAKIKWYPQKLFESNPLLTTLNCFFWQLSNYGLYSLSNSHNTLTDLIQCLHSGNGQREESPMDGVFVWAWRPSSLVLPSVCFVVQLNRTTWIFNFPVTNSESYNISQSNEIKLN